MPRALKVHAQYVGGEKLIPVVWWMDGRHRPDMVTQESLDNWEKLGYTIEDHSTGFKLVYRED